MRIVIQRVASGKLSAGGKLVSEIGPGIMALVGITHGDNEVDADYIAPKLLNLKLWGDGNKAWSKNMKDMDY